MTLSAEETGAALGVSRETLNRLQDYLALLRRWQRGVNLVGSASLDDPWRRHILDCGQLRALAPPEARVWVDLGSGAGLPGLVLAILGVPQMHLIESDTRKCAFLREAARVTGATVTLHHRRIEEVPPFVADVITARALAPLPRLLALAARFAGAATVGLFPKGQAVERELTEATTSRRLAVERLASRSDPAGTILRVGGIHRA